MLIIAIALLSGSLRASVGGEDRDPDRRPAALLWEEAQADYGVPLEDRDHDYMADVEEVYGCGSHDYFTDSDMDGMADYWENLWVEQPAHEGLNLLSNINSLDAYEDPDEDGYDFDGDGVIEGTDDRVVQSFRRTRTPVSPGYLPMGLDDVVRNGVYLEDQLVRLDGAVVVETSADMSVGRDWYGREVTFWVATSKHEPRERWLEVRTHERSHRAIVCNYQRSYDVTLAFHGPSNIDIQGVISVVDGRPVVEVRGTEQFTNLLEYQFRFLIGVPRMYSWPLWYNQTNPFVADTDGDGMKDGWEAFHGSWRYESEGYVVWEGGPNPTCGADAGCDPDGDGLSFLDEYALGTDPLRRDSDSDGMGDDWEVAMGLDPRRADDAHKDPDRDGFTSLQEYLLGTDPRWGGSHP